MTDVSVIEKYRQHLSVGRARVAALSGGAIEARASGSRVWDEAGREYLDCGGYGVFFLGHCHPTVVAAVVDQVKHNPLSTRLLLDRVAAETAEALVKVAPNGLDRVHFVNSGAEATETAIKLARANGCSALISARQGFHGKTLGALSLTANEAYQRTFRPLLPGVAHVPFGDSSALSRELDGVEGRACVVLEPIQGEAGVVIPPAGYLKEVESVCRQHDALLVLDEIQTGLGRIGYWWGADQHAVNADMVLTGKALSGGIVPVAAVLARDDVYRPFSLDPWLHSSTFAASPVALAAASATLRVIVSDGLVERARRLGDELLVALRGELRKYGGDDLAAEVRGQGLLIGVEFGDELAAANFFLSLLHEGVIANHSLNAHTVVRFTPPATLSDEDCEWLIGSFGAALAAVVKQPRLTESV